MRSTLLCLLALTAAAGLTGCMERNSGVRVTAEAPAAVPQSRSEPIFYNGKTYQLDFSPDGAGTYAMVVGGMSANQQKDAVAVATSSLRYFACPDGHTGKLAGKPVYENGKWRMTAGCGRA